MKLKETTKLSCQNKNSEIDDLKKEIDSYRPFIKQLLHELQQFYRIGFTYSSNALEGNSLTESETKVIIEDGLTIGGKAIKEHSEVLGHSEAFTFLNSDTEPFYNFISYIEYESSKDYLRLLNHFNKK